MRRTIHGGGWKSRFESAVSTLVPLGRYEAAACAASRPWPWLRRWSWPAATVRGDSAESTFAEWRRGLLARVLAGTGGNSGHNFAITCVICLSRPTTTYCRQTQTLATVARSH